MQINYCNSKVRRATAGFWWAPSIGNSLQAQDVPPIYAPYGTPEFWPNSTVTATPDTSIAPNSGQGNSVAASMMAAGFSGTPPAASPAVAAATGQDMGPISLVAPMPTITPRQDNVAPASTCNPIDTWVTSNPMMAALGIVGVFLLLGGHK